MTPARLSRIEKAAGGEFHIEVFEEFKITPEDVGCFEVLFGHSISRRVLRAARSLRWFQTASAGVEWYTNPADYASKNVVLTNSTGAYGDAIAEHAMMLTFMVLRRMPQYMRQQEMRQWTYLGHYGRTVYGSVVTVLGLGDLGREYAKKAKAFGARVRAVKRTRTAKPEYVDELFTADELDIALGGADIVAAFLPKSAQTDKILSRARLNSLKKGAVIINAGRGTVIDEEAMIDALMSGHLGGAGLDVTEKEPLAPESRLWDCPNTVITPHAAGRNSVDLILDRAVDLFCENLKAYRAGRPMKNVVLIE